ncbi:transcription termination factor Rho [Candidatus Amesbacteria bacterium RIFCSPHIGHO2_01_FULL_48_32]|uniref:Transcription termination factor Rho n=1 Tax=Candidatus Amesbacteria bacterium RIFCSPLOWO2_01_FULL_48_25 TaxID=1797259 RepID=A0A1F4ZDT4_9BACT|nr:MAG: transcription termination factor Rho [Candidatus Amesbacteria bacterium RIFCSPHIGHO2_01_FULL_48_32]OGD04315.1 MAG: transcription termination factor Rho [Candidatus Amesbacteria bacterium RIFCSPLOWO2_01_FULL_48_25]HJZ05517.1 transcription termination factor Rho [Patescibacteria group bacterium]
MSDDDKVSGVASATSESSESNMDDRPMVAGGSGIRSMMRPGVVRVIGRVAPRAARPVSRQVYGQFDGTVDDRVIPDAGLPTEYVEGFLDVTPDGHGYLRPKMIPSSKDVYISSSQVRRFSLRPGDMVGGQARAPKENERYWGLLKVEKINGMTPEEALGRPDFDSMTAIFPDEQVILETGPEPLSTRIIDLIAPIGRGQRGLIVAQPKAGKTWLMREIAEGITKNYPKMHLMAVLIGERPEEVTEITRNLKGEVAASHFDEPPLEQVRIAELALERAKRLVEMGRDVFVLLDSITRLARAYNLIGGQSGRMLSGGFSAEAIYPAKKAFGAARNIDGAGSLTIIGTCLVDTGSRMDDLIYEEFKGTGNMELHLDRKLADRRVYPSFNLLVSGTRGEEKLLGKRLDKINQLRRMLDLLDAEERTELLINKMKKTKNNDEFLESLTKAG